MINNMNRGFTLIETLGAVLLLSIALVGPMVIAEKGLQASLISKDQNSAFNVAQDAVELVRFSRDTNCLRAGLISCPLVSWLAGAGYDLTPCISTTGANACYFDSLGGTPAVPTACPSNICPVINYDSANNYFTYAAVGGSVASSIFTRMVQIKYDPSGCSGTCNPAEADIVVTVSWSDPVAHSIVVNESLYDWQ
jgi:Tfp pilus assembly protein PilV